MTSELLLVRFVTDTNVLQTAKQHTNRPLSRPAACPRVTFLIIPVHLNKVKFPIALHSIATGPVRLMLCLGNIRSK